MRTRWAVSMALGAIVLLLPLGARAQEKERVWRVGVLSPRRHLDPPEPDYYDELPKRLAELGYVEGRNLVIEWRYADTRYERLDGLAAKLVQLHVDAIVTDGTPSTLAAQAATKTIPIVFSQAGDPVGNGIVKSLARHGGNTTGISILGGDSIVRKQLEMLRAMLPRLSVVAALLNPSNPAARLSLQGLEAEALAANIGLLPVEARTAQEIKDGIARIARQGVGAVIVMADSLIFQQNRQIAALMAKHRLPSISQGHSYTENGGLLSYGSDQWENHRRAATLVDKIFKGANPGDIPVEEPTKLELVINRKTAKALGLTIPPDLLLLADKVIE